MKRKQLLFNVLGAVALGFSAQACSDDYASSNGNGGNGEFTGSKYVIAGTSSEATYLLTADNLNEGEVSLVGNGMEVDNASYWVFYKEKFAYRLVYNQGNAGITTSYRLDEDGDLVERNILHEIQNRFTTIGTVGHQIVTAASGATDQKDANGNPKYGITFTMIDAEKQTLRTKTVNGENLLGTGEYSTVSGIVESNGKIYTAICPEGVSVWGVQNNGHLLSDEAKAIINDEGGISGAINPNQVYVAVYNNTDFENPTIITDNRLSYATSRYRSQYYSNIAPDSDGNIYVFSNSYSTTLTGIQQTDRPSGVLRIKAGTSEFDKDYYVNLEDASVADRAMYKVWHITGDYFLLQMYKDKTQDKSWTVNTHRLGIFKAGEGEFTWVSGLPEADEINSFSRDTFIDNGVAYIAVTPITAGAKPALYAINPTTAVATPGLVVTADGVSALGKLSNM